MGEEVAIGILGNEDEILDVIRQRRRDVREEEGFEFGTLGRAESGDPLEAADGGLDNKRAVGEQENREEVEKVVPGLLAPQGADGEASAPAYCGNDSDGSGDIQWQYDMVQSQREHHC